MPYCEIFGENTTSNYHFIIWNEIIKKYWSSSMWAYFCDLIIFVRYYLVSGIFKTFVRESKTQLIAGFYPSVFFLLFFGVICAVIYALCFSFVGIPIYLKIAFGVIFLFFSIKLFLYIGEKKAVFWLSNIYAFCAKYALGEIKEIPNFASCNAHIILEILKKNQKNKDYEIIISAHSVGTILLVDIMKEIMGLAKNENLNLSCLKILTLGHCIPLVSFQKHSDDFKNALSIIGESGLVWYDFTSTIDGACFPLLDFFRASKIHAKYLPIYKSTRFYKLFSEETYKKIRYNWYLAHFLYLYATEKKGEYDYFNFIGGQNFLETKIK